jgi:5'-deoxynucleotidase YfbR-like HD superfamily hydrolase
MTSHIRTYSGIMFDPLNPKPEDIRIQDIAWALSNICRFNGHTSLNYSVAEHSLAVSSTIEKGFELAGLLHDASEAYLGDIASPLKYSGIYDKYLEVEKRLQTMIYERYRVNWQDALFFVKEADQKALETEQKKYMEKRYMPVSTIHHEKAQAFINRFAELM